MIGLNIVLDREPTWPDLAEKLAQGRLHHATLAGVGGLPDGTTGGKPTVALRIDLPDGSSVVAETTLALFLSAADALRGRFGDPR